MEGVAWHQLGRVAEEQHDWTEAERCYRESLAIRERLDDVAEVAVTCNQLAIIAQNAGRPAEAEGWLKRALEMDERMHPGSLTHATSLSNLANLLVQEVQTGRGSTAHLVKARGYAEQALAIMESLDASSGSWLTLGIIAEIADLEGRTEAVQVYRRREREAYAAFVGNRYPIDRQFGQLIAAITAAAKGNTLAQTKVEAILPELEAKGWQIATVTRRIWAGERDWRSLSEGMDRNSALLVLRVLETLAEASGAQASVIEEAMVTLPLPLRMAIEHSDEAAFQQLFESLSLAERLTVIEAMRLLQERSEEETKEEPDPPEITTSV